MITPIETRYAGRLFRSRLEARWAVFFDKLGISWEYEPEGYKLEDGTWYLPDFRLTLMRKEYWCEVKPYIANYNDWEGMSKFTSFIAENDLRGMYLYEIPSPREIENIEYYKTKMGFFYLETKNDPDPDFLDPGDSVYVFYVNPANEQVGFGYIGKRIECTNDRCDMIFEPIADRVHNHPKIINAFAAARSARFEHYA
jgi:hypothetical protein